MYKAYPIETIERGQSGWAYQKIGVFYDSGQVGEYVRNYPSFYDTFFPFKIGETWYALYSDHYTATSVMILPDCKKIATEEISEAGFCPTTFYVPQYQNWVCKALTKEQMKAKGYSPYHQKWADIERSERIHNAETERFEERFEDDEFKCDGEIYYDMDLALVAGCVCGDDASNKCQKLDLSRINEGIITRSAIFGYLELPTGMVLKDCVRVSGGNYVTVAAQKHFFRDEERSWKELAR